MDVVFFVKVGRSTDLCGVSAHIGEGGLRRFAHDIAHLSGDDEGRWAIRGDGHSRGLHKEDIATHGGPRETGGHSRPFYPFPGGWLEHVLNVTRNVVWLADAYIARFPEMTPPLNRDLVVAGAILHDIGRAAELAAGPPGQPAEPTVPGRLLGHIQLGRDLIRDAARSVPDLNPELVLLLDHIVLTHLTLPEWGSPRLPMIPEVLILHHADDLDAKYELYARHLTRDAADGPFTDRDPVVGKPLLKRRGV